MTQVILALGSNLKCKERQIRQAIKAIKALPQTTLIAKASNYHTKAWGVHAQPDFINTAVLINTHLSPLKLLNHTQKIEQSMGRSHRRHWGARTIDIDIIAFGQLTFKSQRLTLPHPWWHQRDFVLKPVSQLLNKIRRKVNFKLPLT